MSEILTIKKGIELELEIDSLAYGGMGLAKKDSFVIFVKNAIPGQRVKAFIYKTPIPLLIILIGALFYKYISRKIYLCDYIRELENIV